MNRFGILLCRFLWLPRSQTPSGRTAARTFPSLLALAMCLFWWWTYSGLFRWLAELQLALFGSYYLIITLLFSLLAFLIPMGIVGSYVEDAGWLSDETPHGDPERFNVPAGILTLTVMALGVGWFTNQRIPSGDPVEITLGEIRSGRPIPGHVSVQGFARPDLTIRIGGDSSANYTALVPADFVEGDAVVVYVENQPRDKAALANERHQGVLIANGLPGLAREGFKSTDAPPAKPHYLLCYSTAMQGLELLPTIMFSIGGLLGLVSVVMFYLALRQN